MDRKEAGAMDRILISACLLGRPVRYNGRGKQLDNAFLAQWQSEGRLVPVCPEVMAGFPTPRPPAEVERAMSGLDVLDGRAKVFEDTGGDVTDPFLAGAEAALQAAKANGCRFALLTDGSPSCGSSFLYDGSFKGRTVPGLGVVTALLQRHGIGVFAEHQIGDLALALDRDGLE